MKRVVLALLAALIFGSTVAFAVPVCDTSLCPKPPYPVSKGFPKFLSKVTGTNLLLTSIGSSMIERQLKKELGAKFKVKIQAFGGKNLLDGKFKKITADAKNVNIEGFYMSRIKVESLCEYNYFVQKGDDVFAGENFLASYVVVMTSDDLKKTFASTEFSKFLNSINFSMSGFNLFKVFDPLAEIKNNRINLSVKAISPFIQSGRPKTISLNMGLNVSDGQVQFSDIKIMQGMPAANLEAILPLINRINPFIQEIEILKTKGGLIKVSEVSIVNNEIILYGTVFIPKNI